MCVCMCVILKSFPTVLKTEQKWLKNQKQKNITELGSNDKVEFIDCLLSTRHFCTLIPGTVPQDREYCFHILCKQNDFQRYLVLINIAQVPGHVSTQFTWPESLSSLHQPWRVLWKTSRALCTFSLLRRFSISLSGFYLKT